MSWPEYGLYIFQIYTFYTKKQTVKSLNYYAFPTGSEYGFGKKRRQQTPASSESEGNLKILHIVNKAGIFHILFGLIQF